MSKEMDTRFAEVLTDPRFRSLRKADKKVKIDKRFKDLFKRNDFQHKRHDKRGKVSARHDSQHFRKFYDLSDDSDSAHESNEINEDLPKSIAIKPKIPNARDLDDDERTESSSDSDESDSESDDSEPLDHNWNEWDKDVPRIESATKRLAICNLDWDRINASDLFVLLHSFKPADGVLYSVSIYPSQFGVERMKHEETSGPNMFIDNDAVNERNTDNDADQQYNDDEERVNSTRYREQLRRYQITRLKYFYAIVECDSETTANALYAELDGMEFESSSSCLDLRFIPNDMTFTDVLPKSQCSSMPDISSYKPPLFINSALQQSTVKLTWDETDPKRSNIFERAFTNKNEIDDDLEVYLASDDDGDDGDEDYNKFDLIDSANLGDIDDGDSINKYKLLLKSIDDEKNKSEENVEMEISWQPSLEDMVEDAVELKDRLKHVSTFEEKHIKIKDKRKKEKKLRNESKTNSMDVANDETAKIDKNNRSKKNSKTKNIERIKTSEERNLELLLMDASQVSNKKHFNYKNLTEDKKRKQKVIDDNFEFNADDPRFSALYSSHHYSVDPSDPHFKKTNAFDEIISMSSKNKKIKFDDNNSTIDNTGIKDNLVSNSWSHTIRSVKNKAQQLKKSEKKFNSFKVTKFKK